MKANYFQLLNLPVQFDLGQEQIWKHFIMQQKLHHPEIGINRLQKSIELNEAYAILQDPLSRARHLLEISGINIENVAELTPNLFMMLQDAETYLHTSFATLKDAFRRKNLNSAYKAWCECNYLYTYMQRKGNMDSRIFDF